MPASSRGASMALARFRPSPSLCSYCAALRLGATLSTPSLRVALPARTAGSSLRAYSAAAAAATSPVDHHDSSHPPSPATATTPKPYRLHSGIILTRAPLLTRQLTDFENAFFFYQKRLNERLCQPFITELYFKRDTGPLLDWNLKVKERRGTVAKELGVFRRRGAMAWNDELKVGDDLSSQESVRGALLRDGELRITEDAEEIREEDRVKLEKPVERLTDADRKGDVRRLDRLLDRTLYLVVRDEKRGEWVFPSGLLNESENLHEAAQRILDTTAGINMNTWIVGRVPVAHHINPAHFAEDGSLKSPGDKTFFLKGRIMAGQANLANNSFGYTDFKWLAKEELVDAFTPEYFRAVKNMMADR